jgi:hypothetical protein
MRLSPNLSASPTHDKYCRQRTKMLPTRRSDPNNSIVLIPGSRRYRENDVSTQLSKPLKFYEHSLALQI